jgi:hypothetical protein
VGDTVDALIDRLDTKPEYVPTPWPSLDKLIGGLAAGNLVIVGARPGEGKTIVGLQCAARLAHEGVVAFISLEMGEDELQIRLIAQYGEVHMKNLRNRNLNAEQWGRVKIARQRFQKAPIFIGDDITTLTQLVRPLGRPEGEARRRRHRLPATDRGRREGEPAAGRRGVLAGAEEDGEAAAGAGHRAVAAVAAAAGPDVADAAADGPSGVGGDRAGRRRGVAAVVRPGEEAGRP